MIDVKPTLNDHQVMQFIHNGYITLESIIDPDFNKECDAVDGGHLSDFRADRRIPPECIATTRKSRGSSVHSWARISSCRRARITISLKHHTAGKRGIPTDSPNTDTVSHISSATIIRKA